MNKAELLLAPQSSIPTRIILKSFSNNIERDAWVQQVLDHGYTEKQDRVIVHIPKWAIWNVKTWDE